MKKVILVAGATGNLGGKIVNALLIKGAEVRVLVRKDADVDKIENLEKLGVKIFKADLVNVDDVVPACIGVSCVVSALAGLRPVIIDAQKVLLDAAISAGVPRFIPSDYSLDFTPFSQGENRNLDWRREFHQYLDTTSIAATTIFNGAFADMLTGQMPLVLFKQKLVLYWGDSGHNMAFTSVSNTAMFTANAALDQSSPRFLRIAGDQISPKELALLMTEISGEKYRLLRPGGKNLLGMFIKIAKRFNEGKGEIYPAWQGMQYMRNMIDERANITILDNDRYPNMIWTSARDVLKRHHESMHLLES